MTKKYFVFISYARQDKTVALEIQKYLENYRYPADLIPESRPVPEDKFLRPVFVDVTDLTTLDPSYREGLQEAIANSSYMLVLCSKASAREQSVCHWEIATFLKNHSAECILPVALDGTGNESIPQELHAIRDVRNIVLWDAEKTIAKSPENKSNIFKIIEFLLGVDAIILNNRYQNAENKKKKIIFSLITGIFIIISMLSLYAARQSHIVTVKERERVQSETARADFEKKVFPYSLVYSYKENFLKPLMDDGKGEKTIVVIAMPKNYSELNNSAYKRKNAMAEDALTMGWILKAKAITVPGWNRALSTEELLPENFDKGNLHIYADMATTTKAIKAVVDYLITDSPYYSPGQKDELTVQYIKEFQNCLLLLFEKEIKSGILSIYFVHEKESLTAALKNIEKELK